MGLEGTLRKCIIYIYMVTCQGHIEGPRSVRKLPIIVRKPVIPCTTLSIRPDAKNGFSELQHRRVCFLKKKGDDNE